MKRLIRMLALPALLVCLAMPGAAGSAPADEEAGEDGNEWTPAMIAKAKAMAEEGNSEAQRNLALLGWRKQPMKRGICAAVLLAVLLSAGGAVADEAADIDAIIFEAMKQGAVDKGGDGDDLNAGGVKADDLYAGAKELSFSDAPETKKRAARMMAQAAALEHAAAQRSIGEMYLFGDGVKKDEKKAILFLKKAAEQGDEEAMHSLGWLYRRDGKKYAKDMNRLEGLVEKHGYSLDQFYFAITRPAW